MTAWLQLLGACVARTLGGAALGLAGPGVSAADKESPGPLDTCEPRYSRTTGPGAAVRLETSDALTSATLVFLSSRPPILSCGFATQQRRPFLSAAAPRF